MISFDNDKKRIDLAFFLFIYIKFTHLLQFIFLIEVRGLSRLYSKCISCYWRPPYCAIRVGVEYISLGNHGKEVMVHTNALKDLLIIFAQHSHPLRALAALQPENSNDACICVHKWSININMQPAEAMLLCMYIHQYHIVKRSQLR